MQSKCLNTISNLSSFVISIICVEKYSVNVPIEKIRDNEYNLNITRYIDTFVEKDPIDVEKLYHRLDQIGQELNAVNSGIKFFEEKLDIDLHLLD